MKSHGLTAFLVFCLVSGLAAWAAGRACRPLPPTPGSIAAKPVPVATERPAHPAWLAAAAAEFQWPIADRSLIDQAVTNPRHTSQAVLEQILGLPDDSGLFLRESILKLRGKFQREQLLSVLMVRWAAISPAEALTFALTLPPQDAITALAAGLPVWTSSNAPAALAWSLGQYRNGMIPTGILQALPSIAWQWGKQDLPALIGFMQGLEGIVGGKAPGPLRALASGIGGLAMQDDRRDAVLSQALGFAATRGELSELYAGAVLDTLAQVKPASFAGWLDNHPDIAVPKNSFSLMLDRWSSRDPAAALQWVRSTPRLLPEDVRAEFESAAAGN